MKEVLLKIKPSTKEQAYFKSVTTTFISTLNKNLPSAKAILGGSGAKDTWLAKQHDVDIFVLFLDKEKNLSNILEVALTKSFPKHKIQRVHGSRDYFQLQFQDIEFEVVPIRKITKAEEAENITDISPLHSKWVNANGKGIKDDIRLLKQFCKANRLYGAESHIGGFSGYTLEILVINYGSFEKVLQESKKWKEKTVIDVSKWYKNKDVFMEINQSKLHSPLIIIDPVDKSRNAAAALSQDTFSKFKQLAQEYLKNHLVSYFEKKEISLEPKKGTHILTIYVEPLSGKSDVVGSKVSKVFQHIKRKLKPFEVLEAIWDTENKLLFRVKLQDLPNYLEMEGPPVSMKEAVVNFKKKYHQTYVKNGKIFAKYIPQQKNVKKYVAKVFKEKYIQERVKSISVL